MNLFFVNKSIKNLQLREKGIKRYYKPKIKQQLDLNEPNLGNEFDIDYVDDLKLYGFCPFDKKTYKEQRQELSKHKIREKNFNEGFTNYVKKKNKLKIKEKIPELLSTNGIKKRIKFFFPKKKEISRQSSFSSLKNEKENPSKRLFTQYQGFSRNGINKRRMQLSFTRCRISLDNSIIDGVFTKKKKRKKEIQRFSVDANSLPKRPDGKEKINQIVDNYIAEKKEEEKLQKGKEFSLKEQVLQLILPRRETCPMFNKFDFSKFANKKKKTTKETKDSALKKAEIFPKSIFKRNKIKCKVSLTFDDCI